MVNKLEMHDFQATLLADPVAKSPDSSAAFKSIAQQLLTKLKAFTN